MEKKLGEKSREAADWLVDRDDFLLAGHIDADGISATGILASCLDRLGKKYSVVSLKQLSSEKIGDLAWEKKTSVFLDFGSAYFSEIQERLGREFLVLDHHAPQGDVVEKKGLHVNPHDYGYDGATEVSASGVAYLVARQLGFRDLSSLAIVGASGDMQDKTGSLTGLNREILKEAVGEKVVSVSQDLRLYGRNSRNIVSFLKYCYEPWLPGLSGNDYGCRVFLETVGLSPASLDRTRYCDLDEALRKKLVSALLVCLLEKSVASEKVEELVGEVYTLVREKEGTELRDAKEFSTVLNSCGRHGEAKIGVDLCRGDREKNLSLAKKMLSEHRQHLRSGLEWVCSNGVSRLKNLYFFDAGDKIKDTLVGTVAGMLYGTSLVSRDKPVFGLALDGEETVKVSARANHELVERGLDLGEVLRQASARVGGEGGGHTVASGAQIALEKKREFLLHADKIIGQVLGV